MAQRYILFSSSCGFTAQKFTFACISLELHKSAWWSCVRILPGQQRGERGQLDYSDGRLPIIGALVRDGDDVSFAFWDADKHSDFAYSGNMQVKADVIVESLCTKVSETVRNNNERIVCARPQYLYDAIIRRMDIMHEELLGG